MKYEVNNVIEGEVTNITSFGIFVRLSNNQEGLVHISEIANEYIKDITEYAHVGDQVTVKVINITKDGKLELSMKRVDEQDLQNIESKPKIVKEEDSPKKRSKKDDFEKMMNNFLKRSEEKQIDIRRNLKFKQGIVKKKK